VPGEHRPERIRSPNPADRHITNGCLNVERETIGLLERNVTGARTSLYILPEDPSRIQVLFGQRRRRRIRRAEGVLGPRRAHHPQTIGTYWWSNLLTKRRPPRPPWRCTLTGLPSHLRRLAGHGDNPIAD
jgi:hypothetical protein